MRVVLFLNLLLEIVKYILAGEAVFKHKPDKKI